MIRYAISLKQPWASLLAFGPKTIETRDWAAPSRILGQPIGIHASQAFDGSDRSFAIADPDCRTALMLGARKHYDRDFFDPLHPALRTALERNATYPPLEAFVLPLGCIVAVGTVVECRTTDSWLAAGVSAEDEAFGNFGPHRFGWRFDHVQVLKTPMPCKGALGIWSVAVGVAGLVDLELQGRGVHTL